MLTDNVVAGWPLRRDTTIEDALEFLATKVAEKIIAKLPEAPPASAPTPTPHPVERIPTWEDDPERILRPAEVSKKLGISKTTLWRLEREGDFPKRRRISSFMVGWIKRDIDNWIRSRPEVG